MAFQKGYSGNPAGRPKGSQNRSTSALRDALTLLTENNVGKMEEWLDRVAVDDPKAAFQCMLSLMEFHLPKPNRCAFIEKSQIKSENIEADVDKILADALKFVEEQSSQGK